MSNWQRNGDTRDPLTVLLEREAKTCKGCIHLTTMWQQPWCLKSDEPAVRKCKRKTEAK